METHPCLICERLVQIEADETPYFVAELETGYVVLGDFQYWRGYTLFLCRHHKLDLHELDFDFRLTFLREMSEVAAAVHRAFAPHRLNYELLGNSERACTGTCSRATWTNPTRANPCGSWTRPCGTATPPALARRVRDYGGAPARRTRGQGRFSLNASQATRRRQRHFGAYGVCISDSHVLLVRKSRGPYTGLLDLPGGGIEFGEEPEAALRREFIEETGLSVVSATLMTVESNSVTYYAADGVDEELHHIGLIYSVVID